MKNRSSLGKQLFLIVGFVFIILFISLGAIIPTTIMPVVERNIYNRLNEPLRVIRSDYDENTASDIAYLYIVDNEVIQSNNLYNVLKINDGSSILTYLKDEYGKFTYKNETYYYYKMERDNAVKVAITDDSYIKKVKGDILNTIIPIVLITFLLIGLILVVWSSVIVVKIDLLKKKIDHIDDDSYNHKIDFKANDEIKSLGHAIEDMRVSLKNQEEYRNQMYQNISHDFKTPLAVIKSYIEAVEDKVESPTKALTVIKEQTEKLENKVYSLLYLNKLDYLKDANVDIVTVDIVELVNNEVNKFKWKRKDVKFKVEFDNKLKFVGTDEHWETILDNLLNNFMRYAKNEIRITVKQNKIVLYNDGDNINNDLLEGIFVPFRKGIKGEFGLGLSIVKKTLNIIGYDIEIKNEKKGVSFIITKNQHR